MLFKAAIAVGMPTTQLVFPEHSSQEGILCTSIPLLGRLTISVAPAASCASRREVRPMGGCDSRGPAAERAWMTSDRLLRRCRQKGSFKPWLKEHQ